MTSVYRSSVLDHKDKDLHALLNNLVQNTERGDSLRPNALEVLPKGFTRSRALGDPPDSLVDLPFQPAIEGQVLRPCLRRKEHLMHVVILIVTYLQVKRLERGP